VLFRTESQNGNDYFLFLNEVEDEYPLAVAGSYIIRRRSSDGEFTQVKVFLQNNDGSFVRIVPDGLRSRMDIFLSGVRVYRNVPLPFDIRDVLEVIRDRDDVQSQDHLLRDILQALADQNADNWQSVQAELIEILEEEVAPR